jgi:type I restriction enzyme, S subunit
MTKTQFMSGWKEIPFEDLLVDSKDGEWGLGTEAISYQLAEVIRGTDFADLYNPAKELPRRWIKEHLIERKRLFPGDIILETAGGTATQSTGRSVLLSKRFFEVHSKYPILCSSFSRHLRLDRAKCCPEFVSYLLKALYNNGYMAIYNVQHTGVSRFQFTTFKERTILKLPHLNSQRRIAAILSAFDDLIENYQTQISLLEAMAQELYREWFVRGRCPYAQAQRHGLPVGWESVIFTDVISVLSGGTPKTSVQQYWDGDILWFSPSDVRNSFYILTTEKKITKLGLKNCNSKLYPADTVVITARGTVGRCVLLGRPMAINQSNYALIGKNLSQFFVYFKTLELGEKLKKEAIGAVFETITVNNFENAEIILPSNNILDKFDRLIEPIFRKMRNCLEQVEFLRQMRDKLLPRLMNGELSLHDGEKSLLAGSSSV